jgi:hypothetical protein
VDATDGATGYMVTITSPVLAIFSDNFETGDLSRWSGGKFDGGDLAASAAARAVGAYGMAAVIDDNNQIHVTDQTPAAEKSYLARFRFRPNGVAMAQGDQFTLFGAYTDTVPAMTLDMRRNAGQYELRAQVRLSNGATRFTPWIFIADDSYAHDIELGWAAASAPGAVDGKLRLTIDESLFAHFTDIDNDALRVERALLGAVSGIDTGTRGTIHFDEFTSSRW